MRHGDSEMDLANLLDRPYVRLMLGIRKAICPDWGTLACLNCNLGLECCDCDFECHTCSVYWSCPCTLQAWKERQHARQNVESC